MNSRSSVNETNLVNFSADLTTLNQLETKDTLISFPFDHLYACHAESPVRQTIQLDKEVEITTHCVVSADKEIVVDNSAEIAQLRDRLKNLERQNKRLKDLVLFHLDLIQQQNESVTKTEKSNQSLKEENETLKSKLIRVDKKLAGAQRQSMPSSPLLHLRSPKPVSVPVTSTVVKSEPNQQVMLNSFNLLPPKKTSPYISFDSDIKTKKKIIQEPFSPSRSTDTGAPNLPKNEHNILDTSNINSNFKMIENKRTAVKKETKTEKRSEPLYTITSTSGNPVIQKIQRNKRRTSTGIGALSRMNKTSTANKEVVEAKPLEDSFNTNKKSKMINTYGKSKSSSKKPNQFGSLSDRLQLIDTTPTGEDPYQIGEAEMREQSPIPKLMLQKTNHGGMKFCRVEDSLVPSFSIYDLSKPKSRKVNKKSNKHNLTTATDAYEPPVVVKTESKQTIIVEDPDLDMVKTEPEIDWRLYETTTKTEPDASLCDFSFTETPSNLGSNILPPLDPVGFQDLFGADATLLNFEPLDYNLLPEKSLTSPEPENLTKRSARTTSITEVFQRIEDKEISSGGKNKCQGGKRGRKRASSTTGLGKLKITKAPPKPRAPRGKAANRLKRLSPVPGLETKKSYYTITGNLDVSWRLNPAATIEDINEKCPTTDVEVPRWREKVYTCSYTLEGTEDLDDKVFEKRHQKYEAEEKRQLRWHNRRVREQKQVERLRQRQKDSNYASTSQQPSDYTVWPDPQRDLRYIEITDTLPVTALGDNIPNLPASDFTLPWVRSTKVLKRSKRSKTLN